MADPQKSALLEFAATGSQTAFAEIVSAYLPMVYNAALRQVHDVHLAQDVTQAVFIILAKKARTLSPDVVLAGWLIRTTQFAAADALKQLRRQRIHEQKAAAMRPLTATQDPAADALQLMPHIDAALSSLSAADRDALVLRFLQQLPLAGVSENMGISEDAAKQRVSIWMITAIREAEHVDDKAINCVTVRTETSFTVQTGDILYSLRTVWPGGLV